MKHASADAPSTLVLHVETDQVAKAFREEPKSAGPSPRLPLPAPRSAASFVPGRRYRSGRRAPLVPEDGQSRNESFSAQIVSLRACSNRGPWSVANLIPESFQSIELLVWLGVGIIGAALAGLVAGVIPGRRQQNVGSGTIAGFVTAAIILLVSNPDGGRWWVLWAAMGSVMGAGAGAVVAWLFEKILEERDRAATIR